MLCHYLQALEIDLLCLFDYQFSRLTYMAVDQTSCRDRQWHSTTPKVIMARIGTTPVDSKE